MTNFEKIKNMSIDELADKLNDSFACDRCPIDDFCDKNNTTRYSSCSRIWQIWLRSEVQNDERI